MSVMLRYGSTDRWGHIFIEDSAGTERQEIERTFGIVSDLNDRRLVRVGVEHDGAFVPVASSEADDLPENLLHGNPYLIKPQRSGRDCGDDLPGWCVHASTSSPATTE